MAANEKSESPPAVPEFSDADKGRARLWFKKAADAREKQSYDYAIECYVTGLGYWPEAVEEGHMPLRSLAMQRHQVGGKKPGMMDSLKKSMTGKDAKQALLNAEQLLAMDPQKLDYAEGVLKNANKGGFLETAKWVAPIVFEGLKKEKKPNKARFATFRQALVEAAQKAAERGEAVMETWLLDQAVNSLDYLVVRTPGDEALKQEQRQLAGSLTIARGRYEQADDFRDSLRDGDKQKLLHDGDRAQQSEQTLAALIAAARKEYEQAPTVPAKLNALVDTLLKAERRREEDEAVSLLLQVYQKTDNYSLKLRADEIRLRQLTRQVGQLRARAQESGSADDEQQVRLAVLELRQVNLEVFRERVEKYPTDLRMKYRLGAAVFEAGDYDAAIPLLQVAQTEPRFKARCDLLIGRAFYEKQNYVQAADVLREGLDRYEGTDEHSKVLLYWLGRACEAAGKLDEAKAAYGKLLRQDYNYLDGDARKRLDALK